MWDTAKWMPMRIRTTGHCLIRKGSGSVMTQETLTPEKCQILICFVRDFPASHFQSLEKGEDLQMPEGPSSLNKAKGGPDPGKRKSKAEWPQDEGTRGTYVYNYSHRPAWCHPPREDPDADIAGVSAAAGLL